MKTGLHQLLWGIVFAFLLTAIHAASAFYDPTLGRWINRDPIGEAGGKNIHSFVLNNPVNKTDFLGKCVSYSGPNSRRKNVVRYDSDGTTTDVKIEAPDSDLCQAEHIDIVFSFDTSFDELSESMLKDSAEFSCNGEITSFTDFTSGSPDSPGSVNKQWKVTCRLPAEKCHSMATGVTLGLKGQKTMSGPLVEIGSINASINYSCDCPCKIKGCIDVTISATGNQ